MYDVKVCAICLVMDVRLYNLHSYPLESYYETITGLNPLCDYKLPAYVCMECAMQLKKFYHFRGKCLRGQAALYGIIQCNGKITSQDINNIDRENLSLCSNLTIHNLSEENVYCVTYQEHSIKEEPSEEVTEDYLEFEVKQEDSCNDFSPLSSADEDEPLSLHKSNKERKEKTKKARKGSTTTVEVEIECGDDEKLHKSKDTVERLASNALPRPKRGRPKKVVPLDELKEPKPRRTRNTGGVLEDNIELEDYVTIIRLSEEEQKAEITGRQSSSNYVNAPYQCSLCYKGFIDTHAWKHHVSKHDPSAGDLECPVCKFRFKTKRTLQKHASNHEKKYACKACPYVSKTTTQAKQHQRWHKGVTYKCQYCDEVSTKWTSYLSHVRIKHPSEFICGACGYSFVSKLGLTMHRTMMHKDLLDKLEAEDGKPTGPFCEQCDVQFVSEEAWKRHMVTSVKHTKSTDFNNGCRVCGESFPSAEALRLHHRAAHARKRPKNYGKKPSALTWPATCEHCSEVIPNAREYWTHFRRVHPDKNYPIEKNYVCDICGKSFRGNAFLVYHRRTHSERREYECGECGKAFHNRTNLHMHRRTHSDARPHACAVCCKAFKCKGALDRHFRSHTGVKPYECEVCGKAFAQSNSRKLHVRTVHLKQPSPYISRSRLERRNKTLAQKEMQQTHFLY